MTYKCYVCGRSEEDFQKIMIDATNGPLSEIKDKRQYLEQLDEKIFDEYLEALVQSRTKRNRHEDKPKEWYEIHQYNIRQKCEYVENHRKTGWGVYGYEPSIKDTVLDNKVRAFVRCENLEKDIEALKDSLIRIKEHPYTPDSYCIPCMKEKIAALAEIRKKYSPEIFEKYKNWDQNKFKAAISCDYPFESEKIKSDLESCLNEIGDISSMDRLIETFYDSIEKTIEEKKQEYEDNSKIITEVKIPHFTEHKIGEFIYHLCPVCTQLRYSELDNYRDPYDD